MPNSTHVLLGNAITWRLVLITCACLACVRPTLAADGDVSRHFFKIADLVDEQYPSLQNFTYTYIATRNFPFTKNRRANDWRASWKSWAFKLLSGWEGLVSSASSATAADPPS